MTPENSVDMVQRFWREVWSPPYNIDVIDELLADDFVCVNAGVEIRSRAAFKEWVRTFSSRIGNARLQPLDTFSNSDGSKVVSRWKATGSNEGILGLPKDGRPIEFTGISIWQVRGDRLTHHIIERSAFELYKSLTGI